MPIYYGNKEVGIEYVDSYQVGRIYQGTNVVQSGPSDLIALYNIANPRCYTSGSTTVNDLSGNGNNLTITGSVNYVAASASLQITGSTTSSYGQIYSTSELYNPWGGNLLGTGSEFTIIVFQQSVGAMDYNPNWYIGGLTSSVAYKQITNQQNTSFGRFKLTLGSQDGNNPNIDNFQSLYTASNPSIPDTSKFYAWGDSSSSNFGNRRWSMQAFSKTSQASTLNLKFNIRGVYSGSSAWNNTTLLSMSLSGLPITSTPVVLGASNQTTYQTNLDNAYLYIGKNPMYSTTTLPTFMFGGMAIFGKALSDAEIGSYWNYFISGRTA